ncbi:MAG: hydrogenase expression/formation protein HypE [Syntrophales bacterium]|nr:hydrogenase expression/formation protein HypE [Syntrophales bacterium]
MIKHTKVLLEHGSGGLLTHELITEVFLPLFRNETLERLDDSAVLQVGGTKLCFTTDSYVVDPIFFPGGDIGSLAVFGTVNDIAVCGGEPWVISTSFIVEEGFLIENLERITRSMAEAAHRAGVYIVTGDTKVVAKGNADGIFINTSGIGIIKAGREFSAGRILVGDAIIVSGTVGDHGAAILCQRRELGIVSEVISDSAPLNGLIQDLLDSGVEIHFMRDPTRGGLGSVLVEIAKQAELSLELREESIPVKEEVKGLCELLGFDPLFLACEGRVVLFCHARDVERAIDILRRHEYGKDAQVVGEVKKKGKGRLLLRSSFGGMRELDLPVGELVPRIC